VYGERRESPTSLQVTKMKIAPKPESIPIAVIPDMYYRESVLAFFGWIPPETPGMTATRWIPATNWWG